MLSFCYLPSLLLEPPFEEEILEFTMAVTRMHVLSLDIILVGGIIFSYESGTN